MTRVVVLSDERGRVDAARGAIALGAIQHEIDIAP
jgi:hypothetical protein